MKILKVLFLIGGLGVLFASCGSHRGTMCPAYGDNSGSPAASEEVAITVSPESKDLN